jgi:hypothetical protein
VADFELPSGLEHQLETAFEAAAASHAFGSVQHRVDLVGLCAACSSAG